MRSRPNFDLYKALELTKTATQDDITKSYKRLALIHHPDKNLGTPEATSRFQQISTAYEILRDKEGRRKYDVPLRSSNFSPSGSSSNGFDEDEYEMDVEDMVFRAFFSGQSGRNPFGGRGFGGGGGEGFFYSRFGNDGGYSHAQQERNKAAHARERQETALRAQQRAECERKDQERRKGREAQKVAEEKKRDAEAKAKLALEAAGAC